MACAAVHQCHPWMLRVHQADVRQNALFPHLCILQWSTPFQLCGANHLQQSARCYWKTPAGLALRNGLSDQQVVVAVGCCCCCCLGSELATTSRCSAAGSTGWAPAERQIRGHVSEASEGLEKMRIKNRMRSKGKHYPNAHEQCTQNHFIQSNKGLQTV